MLNRGKLYEDLELNIRTHDTSGPRMNVRWTQPVYAESPCSTAGSIKSRETKASKIAEPMEAGVAVLNLYAI